jgi:hypothetical protein
MLTVKVIGISEYALAALVQFFNVEDLSREVVSSFTNTVSENINKGNSKITELRVIL